MEVGALLPHQAVGLGAPQTINRCHRGHYKALSRCRLVGSCVLAKISFLRTTTTFARLTQSAQAFSQSMAFSSPSDQWKIRTSFTFFYFFETLFIYNYCFLYHGDQKSPGGESAGGGRSTSKSTCVVPVRELWPRRMLLLGWMQDANRWSHQLTSDP